MMNLDEAIIHAEEVAEENERIAKSYSKYDGRKGSGSKRHSCMKCAEEHRQLAEWLKELKRARVLLKATHDLLMKQNDSGYVLNLLGEAVFYDNAVCDGSCLMQDIEFLLKTTFKED